MQTLGVDTKSWRRIGQLGTAEQKLKDEDLAKNDSRLCRASRRHWLRLLVRASAPSCDSVDPNSPGSPLAAAGSPGMACSTSTCGSCAGCSYHCARIASDISASGKSENRLGPAYTLQITQFGQLLEFAKFCRI